MLRTVLYTCVLILYMLLGANRIQGQNYVQEQVKLHVDKELYMTGEILWGKVYVIDALFGKPSMLSKVVFVEMWDSKGNLVQQKKLLLKNSSGEISLKIAPELTSGFYQLRAYTKWMANASSEEFARYTFRVFNPSLPIPVSDLSDTQQEEQKVVQVFPEGGKLVDGLETRIGVRISDNRGPVSTIGRIEQADGTVVAVFESNGRGLAEFSLTPDAKQSYGLRLLQKGDSSQLLSLPPIASKGVSIQLQKESDMLQVSTFMHKLQDSILRLTMSKGGYEVFSEEWVRNSKDHRTRIPTQKFPAGKYLIRIENSQQALLAWRYVWIGEAENLSVRLSVSKLTANTREKVRLEVQTSDANGQPVSADLGISIGKRIGQQKGAWVSTKETHGALDMLTHPAPIETQTKNEFIYPELFGVSLGGRIKNLDSNRDSSARVIFTLPGKTPYFRTVKTNSKGEFNIALENIFGIREVGLLAVGLEGTVLDIELDPVFYGKTPYPTKQKLRFSPAELKSLQNLYIQNQLQAAYQDTFPNAIERVNPGIKPFFQYPDKEYILDEYTRFDTEETFNEIVYSVSLRKKKGIFSFRAYNKVTGFLMKPPPLILYDGLVLTDANELVQVNSKLIERIQVVSSIYYQDDFPLHGVINVTSFKGDAAVLNLPSKYIRKPVSFLDAGHDFVKISHADNKLKRIPDQRNLLHWEPRIQTDAQGKAVIEFYTSDITGSFEVQASALSSEGLWGHEQIKFEVVPGTKR